MKASNELEVSYQDALNHAKDMAIEVCIFVICMENNHRVCCRRNIPVRSQCNITQAIKGHVAAYLTLLLNSSSLDCH